MRKAILILLAVAFALVSMSEVKAQGKKKGKEPQLAICKRGKLIFEDDFSGKELEWAVSFGDWRIEKKALVTKSKGNAQINPGISRPFIGVPNAVFEYRAISPLKGNM